MLTTEAQAAHFSDTSEPSVLRAHASSQSQTCGVRTLKQALPPRMLALPLWPMRLLYLPLACCALPRLHGRMAREGAFTLVLQTLHSRIRTLYNAIRRYAVPDFKVYFRYRTRTFTSCLRSNSRTSMLVLSVLMTVSKRSTRSELKSRACRWLLVCQTRPVIDSRHSAPGLPG